jgi:hypothetical protein
VGPDGSVNVVDRGNNRLQKFLADGTFMQSAVGQLNSPQKPAVDGSGNLVVAGGQNNRVEYFDSTLAYKGSFSSGLTNPSDVAFDCKGSVYVADTGGARIALYGDPGATPCASSTTVPPPATGEPATPPPSGPPLTVTVPPLANTTLKDVAKRGLTIEVSCTEACQVTSTLLISRAVAKRLHIAADKLITLGGGKATLRGAGTVKVKIKLNAKTKRKLKAAIAALIRAAKKKRITLYVHTKSTSATGTHTSKRKITLKA